MTTTSKKTKPRSAKLTTVQLELLQAAAGNPDGLVPGETAGRSSAGVARAIASLAKQKLLQEIATGAGDNGVGDETRRFRITAAGLRAIGARDAMVGTAQHPAPGKRKVARAKAGAKEASATPNKAERLIALLKRKNGATLDELIAASGWQAHSVRGFLSGTVKKKLGHHVASERDEKGVRRYRIGT
jgi:hypothetical protein